MNANNHFANRNQTLSFFKPLFDNVDINGRNSKWQHHDKMSIEPVEQQKRLGINSYTFRHTELSSWLWLRLYKRTN